MATANKCLNLHLPKCLYIEITNRCNLRCRSCILYRGGWEPHRDMSLEEFQGVIGQLPNLQRAVLHGIGEPLLNPQLPLMIRALKERQVFVLFNSNAILLNNRRQEELIEAGLDELRISLDAATSRGYQNVRQSDKFEAIVDNIAAFSKRLAASRSPRPKLSLWFLATRENVRELPDFIELASSLGIAQVYLQRLVHFLDNDGYGMARSENALKNADEGITALITRSMVRARELGIQFSASGLTDPLQSLQPESRSAKPWQNCLRPWQVLYVTAHGNVLPCCISPFSTVDYQAIILGNVFKNRVRDVWFGPKYQQFRTKHQSFYPPHCCQGCGINWSL
ncbi:MAG: SPASM domain-containing protein [Deltaproteobacteria bacterium]|nr:SPASM domain-containing protein [Deltaproteobacteria bacterium]